MTISEKITALLTFETVLAAFKTLDISALSDEQLDQLQTEVQETYERIGRESMRRFYMRGQDSVSVDESEHSTHEN